MNTTRVRYVGLVLMALVLVGSILACDIGGGAAKPTIAITAPTSDAQFEEGDEVNVLSSASDAKGVVRVELYVDGDLFRTDSSPSAEGETSLAMAQTWTARDPGVHTLSVIAYNVDGTASDPWAVSIEVVPAGSGVATATPTTSGGAPPAATNTPEPPPEATATTEPTPEETEGPPEETPEPSATPEPGMPDLALDGLSVVPSDPDWGDSLEVSVDVINIGTEASGPYKVLFRWGSGDFDVCEWDKTSLPPMNGGTLHCTVDNIYESYTTEATVDWRDTVDESNEDNNSMTRRVEVGPAPPDLHITEIRFVPDPPVQDSSTHVGVKVHNQGGTAAGSFKVIWRSGEPSSVLEWTISSLAPGASAWAQWPYTYTGHGHFITYAEVDADGDVDELNEDNNEESRAIDVTPS
jgi:hypothetical protein